MQQLRLCIDATQCHRSMGGPDIPKSSPALITLQRTSMLPLSRDLHADRKRDTESWDGEIKYKTSTLIPSCFPFCGQLSFSVCCAGRILIALPWESP